MKSHHYRVRVLGVCVAALLAMQISVRADDQELMERVKQLEKRIAELENRSTQEVSVPSAELPQKTLDFLGQTEISGFVSASFFHNFNDDNVNGIRNQGFVNKRDAFAIHKFKLALEKPVAASPDKWEAGYRADLIAGEDAKMIHSNGLGNPAAGQNSDPFDLEQAFVVFNVPVGKGLLVKVGKFVTLIGLEVIEETANPNWTVGNQFQWVEPFTQTGVQLQYQWTDKIDTEFVVYNGWDQVTDGNNARSFMGRVGLTLCESTSLGLIGYGGPEQTGVTGNWRTGGEALLTQKFGSNVTTYVQLDYGHEDNVGTVVNGEWSAGGVWVVYQACDKLGFALRGDHLKDKGSVRTGFDPTGNTELSSLTATVNFTPIANLQIRPEVRYDHASEYIFTDGAGTKKDQFTIGVGVAYLY